MLIIILLSGCAPAGQSPTPLSPRLAALKQTGKLIVATAITRPFEYHDERTNALVGFDVELAQAIAQRIGVPIEWKEMEFAALLPTLQKGEADMVIAAMYITPQRQEVVDFSEPYLHTGLVVVVRADETAISGINDLNGKIVGVKEGATGARYAARLQAEGVPITVRKYLETLDSLDELEKGFVDAVFNDKLNTLEYIKTHPGVKIVGDVFDPAGLGIAVQKGDHELLDLINDVLHALQTSGELDRMYTRWINPAEP